MLDVSPEEFYRIVVEEFDLLPEPLLAHVDNVIIVTEDEPEDDSETLGYYDGIPLTERGSTYDGCLPDRIVLFRGPLCRMVASLMELRDEIHVTLVHELAHFYGMDDERLHELGWA